jgi:hypothetical protein
MLTTKSKLWEPFQGQADLIAAIKFDSNWATQQFPGLHLNQTATVVDCGTFLGASVMQQTPH